MEVVIIVGAGSTLSDAASKPLKRRPPLDHGFFSQCEKLGYREFRVIKSYLVNNYDIDPSSSNFDSLERMMAVVYADINNPLLSKEALRSFRNIIRLFNRRISESTNPLDANYNTNLYRIIAKKLSEGVLPNNISIITFNQDLQAEKTVQKLQDTAKYRKYGNLFSFPWCYGIENPLPKLTSPPKGEKTFDTHNADEGGIKIFKLHGSLNWFSLHTSRDVPKGAILNSRKKFNITPRINIPVNMRLNSGKRTMHTFPLIIPPVNHKAAIIHEELHPIWRQAEEKLTNANQVVVFGYSCPATDFESANMLRRSTNTGVDPTSFEVIDPNHGAFTRYVDVTCLNHLSYYRNSDAFISKG
jgi:hypothetical protein